MEWILALFTLFAVLALMVWWIGYCDHAVMAETQGAFQFALEKEHNDHLGRERRTG
jgi:hypothetical protein